MSFELNRTLGAWLTILNNRTIEEIYQVDFTDDRFNDNHLPWIFFITFNDFDKYLEIEGDFNGDYIKISLADAVELNKKIEENNQPNLWTVYQTTQADSIWKALGRTVKKIEYGIDKEEFEINGTKIKGQKDVFTFIRFHFDNDSMTIFEGGTGLFCTDDLNVKLNFEETFDKYETR